VTQPGHHIDDELLSAHADGQLSDAELPAVQRHLASCEVCREHLEGFRQVAKLLRRLPELELPRDFSLGPRLVSEPSNVVRLQRWYVATRLAAASLAAVFVLLSAGTLYIDLRPGGSPTAAETKPQVLSDLAPTSAAQPAVAVRAAAPAASPAAAVAPASGAAAPRPAVAPQADDQVAAATSVRALPTPIPTPVPTPAPVAAPAPAAALQAADPAAPFRTAAAAVGVLAVLALLLTLVVRHRLRRRLTQI
jgi:anti-sigma factor RsiW